jgi:hypothetical protein
MPMNRYIHRHLRLGAVGLTCAALGAGASAIATAGAATSSPTHSGHLARHGGLAPRRLLRRTVHADLVVWTKDGFANITVDRGTVKSVSGDQLTLAEGTPKHAYKTVQLTLPAKTRVRDNGRPGTLSARAGQHAIVVQGPHRALVIARSHPPMRG